MSKAKVKGKGKSKASPQAKINLALKLFLVNCAALVRGFLYVKNPLGQYYQRPNEQETTAKVNVPWRKTIFNYTAAENYHVAINPETQERSRHSGPKFHQALEQGRVSDKSLQGICLDMLIWSARKMMTGREQSSESILCALLVQEGERVGFTIDSLDVGRGKTFTREQISERLAYLQKYFTEASERGWLTHKKSSRPMSSATL